MHLGLIHFFLVEHVFKCLPYFVLGEKLSASKKILGFMMLSICFGPKHELLVISFHRISLLSNVISSLSKKNKTSVRSGINNV